jgi:hypothetical protein
MSRFILVAIFCLFVGVVAFFALSIGLYVVYGPDWGINAANAINEWSYEQIRQSEERQRVTPSVP